jgi:hypothetical protein
MRVVIRMNIGRPKTGKNGQNINLYIPRDVVEPAKRHFHQRRRMSLSAGITQLLRKELGMGAAR